MIHYREIPFADYCKKLREEGKSSEADRMQAEELDRIFRMNGWAVVISIMRDLEGRALDYIAQGKRPEFYCGHISAMRALKEHLKKIRFVNFADEVDEEIVGDEVFEESIDGI